MTTISENRAPALRSIVVVGHGVVARTAALALARATPGVSVTLVPAPIAPGALADWFPTLLASGRDAPHLWGTTGDALLLANIAAPRLAASFDAWPGGGRWLHPEGAPTRLPGPGATHARWMNAAAHADVPAFERLFPAAAMLRAGTFAIEASAPLIEADHALCLDPRRLVEWLTPRLRAAGVVASAPFAHATIDEQGHVGAIHLRDGGVIMGDLIVDASGPSALVAGASQSDWIDWRDLPEDRMLVAAAADQEPMMADRYRRLPFGWDAHWPFPVRSLRAVAYRSMSCPEEEARTALDTDGDSGAISVVLGRRAQSWRGNCVAIGEASAQTGALRLAGFTLAQAQLSLLIELLPARDMPRSIMAAFNARAAARADRLRDWLVAHRCDGATVSSTDLPTLAATLARFRRNGGLPHFDEETASDAAWQAVLIGQGLRAAHAVPPASGDDPLRFARAAHDAVAQMDQAATALPRLSALWNR